MTSIEQFSAAFADAECSKIVLAADMSAPAVAYKYVVNSGRNLVVDLGTYTMSTGCNLFKVENGATLTLTGSEGSKLLCTSNQNLGQNVTVIYVENGGTLNIDGNVEIDASKQFQMYYPLFTITNYGTVNMNGGKITQRNGVAVQGFGDFEFVMNGGEIVLNSDLRDAENWKMDHATAVCGDYNSNATVTFNAGAISGKGQVFAQYGNEKVTYGDNFVNTVVVVTPSI